MTKEELKSILLYEYKRDMRLTYAVAGLFGFKLHEWERATQEQRKSLNADELFKK